MSFRLPHSIGPAASRLETWAAALDAEIASERNVSLDKAGRRVETALAALRDLPAPRDPQLVQAAADAVFDYFVTRDACGQRGHEEAIRLYGIPGYVLARVGAKSR